MSKITPPPAMTDEQIEAGRKKIFSTENPFCPCDSKTMRKAAQWAERARDKQWLDLLAQQVPPPPVWYEGAPPFPQDQEWFIAVTTYGDRVVLRSLDEGREQRGNYKYTTADGTYLKKELVSQWSQFPDCQFLPPDDAAPVAQQAVPDGYKLVPVVATWEMLEAALDLPPTPSNREIYEAMLAAAPEAPAQADDLSINPVTLGRTPLAYGEAQANTRNSGQLEASAVDERAAFEAWVAKVQPTYWRAEAWQTEAWAMWQSISAALAQKGGK